MRRQPLVAGNWKMNGSKTSVTMLLNQLVQNHSRIKQAELAVFPPFVFLQQCEQALMQTPISWGAQNVSHQSSGAHTGEIAASMLQDLRCRYVIVGHSERRILYNETNELVAAKFEAVLAAGMRPVLCVGETQQQRIANKTTAVVKAQLTSVLDLYHDFTALQDAVIAYEPIWAIGTGNQASPQQIQEVHTVLREQLSQYDVALAGTIRILYGGSVKPNNAAQLFAIPNVDGALVGGASLNAEQFLEIGSLCNNLS